MPKESRIDKQLFEQLCVQQISEKEIAEYFGVTRDAINKYCHKEYDSSFSAYLQQKRMLGRAVLVNKALKLAEKNGAVMIFLLKNWCGMKDTPTDNKNDNAEIKAMLNEWSKPDEEHTNEETT